MTFTSNRGMRNFGLELNPSYATAHHWYADHLSQMGRNNEAIAEMRKAEHLDPLSLIISADMAGILLVAHLNDEAIAQSRKTVDMDPNFAIAHLELGQAFVQKHSYSEAIAEFQKAIELSGGSIPWTSNLAYAYAVSNKRNEAVKILNDLKTRSTCNASGKRRAFDTVFRTRNATANLMRLLPPARAPLAPDGGRNRSPDGCKHSVAITRPSSNVSFRNLQVQTYPLTIDQYGTSVEELLPGTVVGLVAAQRLNRKEELNGFASQHRIRLRVIGLIRLLRRLLVLRLTLRFPLSLPFRLVWWNVDRFLRRTTFLFFLQMDCRAERDAVEIKIALEVSHDRPDKVRDVIVESERRHFVAAAVSARGQRRCDGEFNIGALAERHHCGRRVRHEVSL